MKNTKICIAVILASAVFLFSCQKEVSQNSFPEPVMEKEISFSSYEEFLSLTQNDPGLVLKVKTADLDLINENLSEAEFCRIVRLMKMPVKPVTENGALRTGSDIVVTLPTMVVYGSWPGFMGTDWYLSSGVYSGLTPSHPMRERYIALVRQLNRDPLRKDASTAALLPNFKFNEEGGLLKLGFEKISENQIKAELGLVTGNFDYDYYTRSNETLQPTAKGKVTFMLNKGTGGTFTGASFSAGSGSYSLVAGGQSINIKTSGITLSITPAGKVSNLQFNTAVGNYNIWTGSNLVNNVNVGFTNTISKTFTTTFQGGYDNGKLSGGFKGSYGPLSGQINFGANFDAGIQLKFKF
jgi:hypothetical protein